jgi:polyribonucleotide 5'-hydroxyl-kinase
MEVVLSANQEYRIEVGESQKLKLMVLSGIAEIKGQELLNERWYIFRDTRTFVFTFTGCRLKTDGTCELQYVSDSTNVPQIFNLFHYFYSRKFDYTGNRSFMVIGNGRSTFCHTLINYIVRFHRKVLFTELDPSKGNIFPGALSTIHIDTPIDCVEGIRLNNPLSFFYGSTEIGNPELYDLQTSRMQEAIKSKGIEDLHIVLAPEGTSSFYNTLIKRFEIDKVIVVNNERMYHSQSLIVEKLLVTGGEFIPGRDTGRSISRYFKGTNNEFTPYSFNVKYKWRIVRVGELYTAPESALPLGAARKVGCVEASEVEPVDNAVLAISEAKEIQDVAGSPVVGYVVVITSNPLKILCTQPKLPKHTFMIQGHMRHIEY